MSLGSGSRRSGQHRQGTNGEKDGVREEQWASDGGLCCTAHVQSNGTQRNNLFLTWRGIPLRSLWFALGLKKWVFCFPPTHHHSLVNTLQGATDNFKPRLSLCTHQWFPSQNECDHKTVYFSRFPLLISCIILSLHGWNFKKTMTICPSNEDGFLFSRCWDFLSQ